MTENELNSINSGEPLKEEATGSVPTADDQQTGQPAAQQEDSLLSRRSEGKRAL